MMSDLWQIIVSEFANVCDHWQLIVSISILVAGLSSSATLFCTKFYYDHFKLNDLPERHELQRQVVETAQANTDLLKQVESLKADNSALTSELHDIKSDTLFLEGRDRTRKDAAVGSLIAKAIKSKNQ